MRVLAAVLLTAGLLPAQIAGGRAAGGVSFANSSGYGNVAFPGTGRPSFATSLGATVAGRQIPLRNGIGGGSSRRNGIGGVGYIYPSYIGGYDSSYYDQSGYGSGYQQQQPNVTIINNPAPPAVAPTVVINQYMGVPPDAGSTETTHIFQPANRYPTQPADDATNAPPHYFLIAFKDHSVYSALAYWVEDKTMHYVTPQQTHNQASLDLIDMDFTKKLNQQ